MATLNKFLRENKVSKMTKAERNAWYNALTKPQKAIAICEDVLLQIKNEKYAMTQGVYVELNIDRNITQRTVQDIFRNNALDETLQAKSISCSVCAMGSCLLSAVRLGNEVTVDDVVEFDYDYVKKDEYGDYVVEPGSSLEFTHGNDVWKKLEEAFTEREYRAMEFMFEGGAMGGSFLYEDVDFFNSTFTSNFQELDSTEKMVKMCKQIIKDGGYFLIEGVDLENQDK